MTNSIIMCEQCNNKYVDRNDHNGLCDSCYDLAMKEFCEEEMKWNINKAIQLKGKVFVQHLLNCNE